jgi:hypothetical protein
LLEWNRLEKSRREKFRSRGIYEKTAEISSCFALKLEIEHFVLREIRFVEFSSIFVELYTKFV